MFEKYKTIIIILGVILIAVILFIGGKGASKTEEATTSTANDCDASITIVSAIPSGLQYKVIMVANNMQPNEECLKSIQNELEGVASIKDGYSLNAWVFDDAVQANKAINEGWGKDAEAVNSCMISYIYNQNGTMIVGNPMANEKYSNYESLSKNIFK